MGPANRTAALALLWAAVQVGFIVGALLVFGTEGLNTETGVAPAAPPSLLVSPGFNVSPILGLAIGWPIFGLSILAGYVLADSERAIKAALFSEFLTFTISPLIIAALPSSMIGLSSDQEFLLFGIMAFPIVFLGLIGALLGSVLGDWIKEHTSLSVSLDIYRILLVTILLMTLVGSANIVIQTQISDLNKTIDLHNSLQNSIKVVNYKSVQWRTGAQNVSADFGPVRRLSGFLEVYWYSTAPVSFYIMVLQSIEMAQPTNGTSSGHDTVALVSASGPGQVAENFTAWFQIDACPRTGCALGQISYSLTIWY